MMIFGLRKLGLICSISDPSPVEKAATSKPLPSYDELKKQSETELLKVGSFLKGKTEIVIHEKNTDKKSDAGSVDEGEVLVNVPLIDKHAQGALRRRIVHDQLERT